MSLTASIKHAEGIERKFNGIKSMKRLNIDNNLNDKIYVCMA